MYRGRIISRYIGYTYLNDKERVIERVDGTRSHLLDLKESLKHVNHSPTGFSWGYAGSGPHQTAFAILFDYLKDKNRVMKMYNDFVFAVIARLDGDKEFELTDREIENFITQYELNRMKAN